jgi:CRP-like cAMP-binding protein
MYKYIFVHVLHNQTVMNREVCKVCPSKSTATQYLKDNELDILGNNCAQVSFKTGDIIIKQNSLSTNVAYVKTGLVKLHMQGPIKEMIIRIVKAPTYLCLPSTFGDKINHFSATALESTNVCFIDFNTFRQFVYSNGDFAYQILLDLSKAQLQSFHNCINNAQKHSIGKVAESLLFFSNDIYKNQSFTLPVSRQDLGDMSGTTRESVSRILTDFHNDRIIETDGRKITILNEPLLRQIANKG